VLASAAQVALRHPANLRTVHFQHRPIIIDSVVLVMPPKLRVQHRPHLAGRSRQLMMKPKPHLQQLYTHLLARRLPFQFELTCSTMTTVMSESEKIESSRNSFTQSLAIATGKASES